MTRPSEAPPERLLTPRFCLVVLVGLAYFLAIGMLQPVVPVFVHGPLAGGDLAVGIAVGAFAAGAVLLRPFAGRIGDRRGRKVLIVGGALMVAVAVVGYHLATSVTALVLARLLGGAGEAGFFVGAGTMITDLAPADRRGEAISYWSVAVYGGVGFGPTVGVFLLDQDHFGRVWTVSAALALTAALLGLLTRETADRSAPVVDPVTGRRPPLLHRSSLAPGVVLFLGLVALAGFVGFVPLYVHDIGMTDSGSLFLVYGCTVLVVRIFGARLPDRLGPRRAGTGATGLTAIGMTVMATVPTVWGVFLGTLLFSMGMSLLYPALLTLALTGVPDQERGSAVGTVSSFFDASQGLGAIILGAVASFSGYRGAFLVGGLLAALGLVVLRSGIDPRTRLPTDHDAAARAKESLEPE